MRHTTKGFNRAAGISALVALLLAGGVAGPVSAQESGAPATKQAKQSPPPLGPAKDFKLPPIQEKRLANGLRVLVIEDNEQPIVSLNLMIKSGATAEPRDKSGLAQLAAALATKGTTTKSAKDIAEAIDSAGGALGVNAGWDSTIASTTVLANKTDLAAALLADVLINPAFKDEEIDRLRTQTLSALQVANANAGTVADEVFDRAVYGDLPYGRPIGGTADTIRAIKRDDLVAFQKANYIPNNATIAIVGAIKPQDAFALVEKHFGSWAKGQVAAAKPMAAQATKRRVIVVDKPDAVQTEIRVGLPAYARGDADYFAGSVTNWILGGAPFSSWIEDELRVKRGLTYGAGSQFDARLLAGAYQVETNTKTATTVEAVHVILDQLDRIRRDGVTQNELKQREGALAGGFLLRLETADAVAGRLLQAELYGLPANYLDTYTSSLQAVTVADVKRIAEKRIRPDELVIVLVGKAAEFEDKLKDLGPVEKIPFDEVDVMAADMRRAKAMAPVANAADAKAGLELANKVIAASGGEAYVKQKSIILKGSGTISPGPQTFPAKSITIYQVFPNKERIEIDLGIIAITQASNGEIGWVNQGGQVQDNPNQSKDSEYYGVDVLRKLGQDGWSARILPDMEVNGKQTKSFAITYKDGQETTFFVDSQTFLPSKITYQTRQAEIAVYLSDYRDVSGIQIPFAFEQWVQGSKLLVATFTEAQVNTDIDSKLFEKPQ